MIVVVEGIDKVGKTTLVNKLVTAGFINLKDEFLLPSSVVSGGFPEYSIGKCESFVKIAKDLSDEGKNVVIDRLHFTEMIYGLTDRRGSVNERACWSIDMELAKAHAKLVYVQAENLELSNKLHGADQTKKHELFNMYVKMSSMQVYRCSYSSLDDMAITLINDAYVYDFYFASPFFNPEQVEREERMIAHLRGLGFKVFSPKENCHLDAKASQHSRSVVFSDNCTAIKRSRAVFAVTDGKDIGTIWEAGYAYGINKPVIYFAETLGDNKFNLMLAQSGRDVYLSQEEVTYGSLIDSLMGGRRSYRGDIE